MHVAKAVPRDQIGDDANVAEIGAAAGPILIPYTDIRETETHVTLIRAYVADPPLSKPYTAEFDQDALFRAWKQSGSARSL